MQIFAGSERQAVSPRGPGVRLMLLTDRPDGLTARRLAAYGCMIDIEEKFDAALSGIIGDAIGYDLFVMDCDAFGGILGAERAVATLISAQAKMRVMLVSKEFDVPSFPLGLRTAVSLPEETPEGQFRRGYDHALRDRSSILMM